MHLDADKCAYFEKNVFFSGIVVVDPWHTTGGAKRSGDYHSGTEARSQALMWEKAGGGRLVEPPFPA